MTDEIRKRIVVEFQRLKGRGLLRKQIFYKLEAKFDRSKYSIYRYLRQFGISTK